MSHSMSDHCKASLRVNETLAMSGEQAAVDSSSGNVKKVAILYLGGLPPGQNATAELPVTVGITGCISRLQVSATNLPNTREEPELFHCQMDKKTNQNCFNIFNILSFIFVKAEEKKEKDSFVDVAHREYA